MWLILVDLTAACVFCGEDACASCSVDLWSSKHSKSGYAALDIQHCNPKGDLTECTLAVGEIPGEHAAEVLKDWVIKEVRCWIGCSLQHWMRFT